MSLMGMRHGVKKYAAWIYVPLALSIVVGTFAAFGSNLFTGGQDTAAASAEQPVAVVGGISVTRSTLDRQLEGALQQQRQYQPNPTPLDVARTRLMLLEQYKQQAAVAAAAKAERVAVTDDDIARARDQAWSLQRGQFLSLLNLKPTASDREIDAAIARQQPGMTLNDLKEQLFPVEQIRYNAMYEKLQDTYKEAARAGATADKVKQRYSDIKVRHILIKTGEGGMPEEQARNKAQKLLDAVKKNPADMPRLANENTEDPGNQPPGKPKQGGVYDWAPANRYVPAFTDAALAVKPGQVNPDLVKTSYGFHIVKLEGIRPGKDLPKDFDKNKQKYIDEHVNSVAAQKAQDAIVAAQPGVKVEIRDPLLRAVQLHQEAERLPPTDKKGRADKLNAALTEIAAIKDSAGGEVPFLKAAIYETLDRPQDAIAAYQDSVKSRDSVDTRLALARLYLKVKDTKSAVAQIQAAENLVRGEVQSQGEIAFLYSQAGRADLSKQANQKYQEMLKRQAQLQEPPPGGANVPLPAADTGEPKAGG